MMLYLRDFLCCLVATAAFCLLMRAPRRTIPFTALTAALGWMLYDLLRLEAGTELGGYFAAALFVALCAEFGARRARCPALLFLFPALIPYVPGVGLYETMLHMAAGSFLPMLQSGVRTLLIAGTIAAAVAIVNLIFSLRRPPVR